MMLEVHDLVVAQPQGAAAVLDGISLQVRRGEKVAILGASGAGKTTLFRAISGFLPIRSGTITVDGCAVNGLRGKHLRALRRRIGMISQRHDMVDRLKVYQNVMAGALGRWSTLHALRFLAYPFQSELAEAEHALEKVGMAHKLRARTSALSGGEHQRVAIARALIQQPLILLADEPIASLDPALSRQILDLLCGLAHETGFTLICSLHQPEFAHEYFDRVIKMTAGSVESNAVPPHQAPVPGMEVGA
jgi:phosphonate transport system ATP-binding protein